MYIHEKCGKEVIARRTILEYGPITMLRDVPCGKPYVGMEDMDPDSVEIESVDIWCPCCWIVLRFDEVLYVIEVED